MTLTNIVSVEFSPVGRIYDFTYEEESILVGDQVVVETERGLSLAKVVKIYFNLHPDSAERIIKPILRKATEKDLNSSQKISEDEALKICAERIKTLKLNMKVLKVEVQFGGSKVIVYFSAPGRVDFRELVKQLATSLKSRVELKQVGARDEAKLLGGMGICGREFCCSTFLREFVPVSIKMAKVQNLALNPTKVSGGCGRLLCCLTYENDTYIALRRNLPARGSKVRILSSGEDADVLKVDIINQRLLVEKANGKLETFKAADVEVLKKAEHTDEAELDDNAGDWGQGINLSELEKD
ncbi:MAG: stage 0 sporulation protein [Oligoflexales bacterium]|nr:stage 0 sporulation protein [Oligoflexales bacterium]